jgi:hypothetical protein
LPQQLLQLDSQQLGSQAIRRAKNFFRKSRTGWLFSQRFDSHPQPQAGAAGWQQVVGQAGLQHGAGAGLHGA